MIADTLAVYRLTRLVVADSITETLRRDTVLTIYSFKGRQPRLIGPHTAHEIVAADSDPPKLAELITCPWCASMYVAAGVLVIRSLVPRVWKPVATALAMSAVAGLLSGHEHN